MNREDLIRAIAEQSQLTKEKSAKVLEGIVDTITQSLRQGEAVTINGFGSFKTTQRAERQGRNPRTGAPITISATVTPTFTAGKTFKDFLKK